MAGVSAIIVTRGNVDLSAQIAALPKEWEVVVWDNGVNAVYVNDEMVESHRDDVAVYGRYLAIEYATHKQIYVQDDDCIVSDPERITQAWFEQCPSITLGWERSHSNTPYRGIVSNMPERFRHDFYERHALVGFGASFERDAPRRAFDAFFEMGFEFDWPFFYRTCDIVFTGLTEHTRVDVPHEDMPYASDPDRMWRQPTHQGERSRMLELVTAARQGLGLADGVYL